jgi:hypothetical protein
MIIEAVNRFQSKRMDIATMYFDIFARFGLVSIGIYQLASMTVLWTNLNAKHDEIS